MTSCDPFHQPALCAGLLWLQLLDFLLLKASFTIGLKQSACGGEKYKFCTMGANVPRHFRTRERKFQLPFVCAKFRSNTCIPLPPLRLFWQNSFGMHVLLKWLLRRVELFPSQIYRISLPYGITQCLPASQHKWTQTPSPQPKDSRLTYPRRIEGWVDIGDWLHMEIIYLASDSHQSKYQY